MNDISTPPAAPRRVLDLQEGCNFRDLGGYRAQDGRHLRWGRVFRSGVMAHFSASDQAAVRALGIRTVIDLRRTEERRKEPSRWIGPDVRLFESDHPMDSAALSWISQGTPQTLERAREALIGVYHRMPDWLAPRLRDLFLCLAAGDVPLLFNCSAGKDRTGFAAALVLETAGVPRDVVLQDYALTNEAVDLGAFVLRHHAAGLGLTDEAHPLLSVPLPARAAMLTADPDYLNAALDRVDREHGSVIGYLRGALGLDDRAIQAIRDRLLA